jgi:hypothetical protein
MKTPRKGTPDSGAGYVFITGLSSTRESFRAWTTVMEPVRAFAYCRLRSALEAWRACGHAVRQ